MFTTYQLFIFRVEKVEITKHNYLWKKTTRTVIISKKSELKLVRSYFISPAREREAEILILTLLALFLSG